MLPFTVDLKGDQPDALIGWRAKRNTGRIDLDRRDYDPLDFWEPMRFHKEAALTLVPDEFYFLMTKEAIAVPPGFAAEMLPYDTRAGEFRVHYAGFFDPGFGWSALNNKAGSSRGVLEVRSHEVPFLLEHGQTVGWLRYERIGGAFRIRSTDRRSNPTTRARASSSPSSSSSPDPVSARLNDNLRKHTAPIARANRQGRARPPGHLEVSFRTCRIRSRHDGRPSAVGLFADVRIEGQLAEEVSPPYCSAMRAPPPAPKMCSACPQ